MSRPSDFAFLLAYKSWLETDVHYWRNLAGRPSSFDVSWLREIGRVFMVNRTIVSGTEERFVKTIVNCGQGNEMALEERAARLSNALKAAQCNAFSAASKLSWFIWPAGWTMFDDLAAKAVIGSPLGDTQNKFERFYVSLAMRGWNDLIKDLRVVLREYRMQPLIAERAIDKYLMLVGMTESERDRVCGYVNSFLSGLPSECSDTLIRAGEEISELLENGAVLHRNTATDRQNLKARLEEFRAFKNEIE